MVEQLERQACYRIGPVSSRLLAELFSEKCFGKWAGRRLLVTSLYMRYRVRKPKLGRLYHLPVTPRGLPQIRIGLDERLSPRAIADRVDQLADGWAYIMSVDDDGITIEAHKTLLHITGEVFVCPHRAAVARLAQRALAD